MPEGYHIWIDTYGCRCKYTSVNLLASVTADHGFGYALRYRRDGHDRMETYGRRDHRSISDEESWIPMNLTVRRDYAALRGVGEMTAAERMHRDNAIEDTPRYKRGKGAAIRVCDLLHRGQHLLRQLSVFMGIVPFDIQSSSL
jgi:hypothetical protein